MKNIVLFILLIGICPVLLCTAEGNKYDFSNGYDLRNWTFLKSSQWRIINLEGEKVLHLVQPGKMGSVRAPKSAAIFTAEQFKSFEIKVTAKCLTDTTNLRRDLCIFFGYQDSLHYYYAHFSGISDQVHNIIAIVNNKDREKINIEPPGSSDARIKGDEWYKLRITRDVRTGHIKAYVNEDTLPVMTAIDKTFDVGYVGIGSFDDTAYFKNIVIATK